MTLEEAVKVCIYHEKWRAGGKKEDMLAPYKITEMLKALRENAEQDLLENGMAEK